VSVPMQAQHLIFMSSLVIPPMFSHIGMCWCW